MQPWDRNPQAVRCLLSQGDIPARDKRVRFVGLSKYEAESGLVKRDLFPDGEQGVYILDAAKLTRLVNEKLEALAEEVKADGWKWVEVQPEIDHQALAKLRRIYAPELRLSADTEAELAKLQEQRNALCSQFSNGEKEENNERPDEHESTSASRKSITGFIRSREIANGHIAKT